MISILKAFQDSPEPRNWMDTRNTYRRCGRFEIKLYLNLISKRFHNMKMGLGLSVLCSFPALADGVDPMFKADGSYIDDIEIMGDVTSPFGETLAMLLMEDQHLKFFVDPAAVYVMMDENNPIFEEKTPFYGYWVSTQSVDIADWPACDYEVKDETGTPYAAHGTLVWTNSGIAENGYDLIFNIDLGTCSGKQEPWAYSLAAVEALGTAGVPHDDISLEDIYDILTEADGEEYLVDMTPEGTKLTSLREMVFPSKDGSGDPVLGHEVLMMMPDCTTSSWRHGNGTWSWANGGFVLGFDDVGFSFPRQDAPIENDFGCRM